MQRKLSIISSLHYVKLIYRGALFLWALMLWLTQKQFHTMGYSQISVQFRALFYVMWVVFAIEMIARFFPSPTESMGCQKQFAKNLRPVPDAKPDKKKMNHGVLTVVASWIALNGFIALLYFRGIVNDGFLILVALFYAVADMICILFFCPFQTWMMKNRCCTTCRIYNWDYLMMCTPLILIPAGFTWSLTVMAILLFIRWELNVALHPERFTEETNQSMRCTNCQEKLCHHKKQLHSFWKHERIKKQKDCLQE